MRTTVNLQEPFTYSILLLALFIIIIIVLAIYLIYSKKTRKVSKSLNFIPEKNIKNIPVIKDRHIQLLNDIETDYKNNKINLRKAYQLISGTVRQFVFEVTNIKTQNYALKELKELNIPELYELIKEYYEPEFASKTVGDIDISINKARRIIIEWK